jgi:hypothetical protein
MHSQCTAGLAVLLRARKMYVYSWRTLSLLPLIYISIPMLCSQWPCCTSRCPLLAVGRTQVENVPSTQHHPIIMCPGLGSSGAYSFDLSPNGEHSTAWRSTAH